MSRSRMPSWPRQSTCVGLERRLWCLLVSCGGEEVLLVLTLSSSALQEAAVSAFRLAYEKAVGLGYRMDIVFYLIRIGLFFMDHDLITRNIEKAKS